MEQQTNHKLRTICQIIGQTVNPEQIYLFGSYAYGNPTSESDFDLYVVLPNEGARPSDAVKMIRRALFDVQDMPLDVIACRAGEFQRRQQGASLERTVVQKGVRLYG